MITTSHPRGTFAPVKILTASKFLINKHRKKAEAIVFITTNKLALPFKLFHKREMFIGKLLSNDINKEEFFDRPRKFSRWPKSCKQILHQLSL